VNEIQAMARPFPLYSGTNIGQVPSFEIKAAWVIFVPSASTPASFTLPLPSTFTEPKLLPSEEDRIGWPGIATV